MAEQLEFDNKIYYKILAKSIRDGVTVPFNCYIFLKHNQRLILFIEKETVPVESILHKIQSSAAKELYIEGQNLELYNKYLLEFLRTEDGEEYYNEIKDMEDSGEFDLIPQEIIDSLDSVQEEEVEEQDDLEGQLNKYIDMLIGKISSQCDEDGNVSVSNHMTEKEIVTIKSALDKIRKGVVIVKGRIEEDNSIGIVSGNFDEEDNSLNIVSGNFDEEDNSINIVSGDFDEEDNSINIVSGNFEEEDNSLNIVNGESEVKDNSVNVVKGSTEEVNSKIAIEGEQEDIGDEAIIVGAGNTSFFDTHFGSSIGSIKEIANASGDSNRKLLKTKIGKLEKALINLSKKKVNKKIVNEAEKQIEDVGIVVEKRADQIVEETSMKGLIANLKEDVSSIKENQNDIQILRDIIDHQHGIIRFLRKEKKGLVEKINNASYDANKSDKTEASNVKSEDEEIVLNFILENNEYVTTLEEDNEQSKLELLELYKRIDELVKANEDLEYTADSKVREAKLKEDEVKELQEKINYLNDRNKNQAHEIKQLSKSVADYEKNRDKTVISNNLGKVISEKEVDIEKYLEMIENEKKKNRELEKKNQKLQNQLRVSTDVQKKLTAISHKVKGLKRKFDSEVRTYLGKMNALNNLNKQSRRALRRVLESEKKVVVEVKELRVQLNHEKAKNVG